MTEQHPDEPLPPEVQHQIDAAEAEEATYLDALHGDLRAMHLAQIGSLVNQVGWLRSRTVELNVAIRLKDDELASLRAQLAAYQLSEGIDQAASAEPGESPAGP